MNQEKINQVTHYLQQNQLDAAVITNWHSVSLLTGFSSDPIERVLSLVVFADHEPFLFGPVLEVNAMKNSGWSYAAYGYDDSQTPWQILSQHILATQVVKAVSVEADNLSLARFNQLQHYLPNTTFAHDITDFINQIRLIKTEDEIAKMFLAGKDADFALKIGFNALKSGMSELAVAAEIEYQLKKSGVPAMSFESLVQFGPHASDPHGATSDIQLKKGELALFDLGTMHSGYASDVSRTVAFGPINDKQKEIYHVVLEAQLTAQSQAKIGMTAHELDSIARNVITKAGYGDYFIHRLGHGLGASVHEYPSIAQENDLILQENMVFSIEPGIYLPGIAGVRIEDSIVLTKDGAQPFTKTSKELLQIN